MQRRSFLAASLAASCLKFAGRSHAQGAPVTPEMIVLAADVFYMRELERARARRALDTDRSKLSAARRGSQLLLEYAPTFAPVSTSWSWAVDVETREEPIAYCVPGGKVMLSTGLVDRTRLAPEELAVVIAHVICHAFAEHDAKEAVARLAELRESPDPNRRILQLADILAKLILDTPHDMATERAADRMTLEFMARSGVDPQPAPEAWRKIARAGGARPPGFLALHPVWSGRIDEIEAQMPAILPVYEEAKAALAARTPMPRVRMRPGR